MLHYVCHLALLEFLAVNNASRTGERRLLLFSEGDNHHLVKYLVVILQYYFHFCLCRDSLALHAYVRHVELGSALYA